MSFQAVAEAFVFGEAAQDDLLDVLLGWKTLGLGFGGQFGFDLGLELMDAAYAVA